MSLALLLDFGSTFTKMTVVDVDAATPVARAMVPTTVHDINVGLRQGLTLLADQGVRERDLRLRLACSSAAGGLRMIAIGLVPELTAEAARRAALGAGARVVDTLAYKLTDDEVDRIIATAPDIVLLAGGTDGGNKDVLLANAEKLAAARVHAPVVVAGNSDAADEAAAALAAAGIDVRVTENVMPELGVINVEPARQAIRDVFFEKIVEAKGLHVAQKYVEGVFMPTPAAVLAAATLLAEGVNGEGGFGEVAVVDVGGATTDVHSVAPGTPTARNVTLKGLPEPIAKRTVEGDLGVRVSAVALLESLGEDVVAAAAGLSPADVRRMASDLTKEPERLPQTERERALDRALARAAAKTAMTRHVGTLEVRATPLGLKRFQVGKDLSALPVLIGTGGVIVYGGFAGDVLGACLAESSLASAAAEGQQSSKPAATAQSEAAAGAAGPRPLLPEAPALFVDGHYLLSAAGLLAQRLPDVALELLKTHLRPVQFGAAT